LLRSYGNFGEYWLYISFSCDFLFNFFGLCFNVIYYSYDIYIYEQSENKLIAIYHANLLQVAQGTLANVDVALRAAGVDNVGTKDHGVDKAGCVTDSSNQVQSFVFERSMYSIPPVSIARNLNIYTTLCDMRWHVPVTVAIVVTILLLMMIYKNK
jgi:hypothetical protein